MKCFQNFLLTSAVPCVASGNGGSEQESLLQASVVFKDLATIGADGAVEERFHVCSPGMEYNRGACIKCQPGRFATKYNSAACITCPENTYAPESGSAGCIACEPGKTSLPGSLDCKPKPADGQSPMGDEKKPLSPIDNQCAVFVERDPNFCNTCPQCGPCVDFCAARPLSLASVAVEQVSDADYWHPCKSWFMTYPDLCSRNITLETKRAIEACCSAHRRNISATSPDGMGDEKKPLSPIDNQCALFVERDANFCNTCPQCGPCVDFCAARPLSLASVAVEEAWPFGAQCPQGKEYSTEFSGCIECQAGRYAAATTDVCIPCPENTYAPETGAAGCTTCEPGKTSLPGSLDCKPKPADGQSPMGDEKKPLSPIDNQCAVFVERDPNFCNTCPQCGPCIHFCQH